MNAALGLLPPGHLEEPTPIVIVGHVDHGKSTLIGRFLHDTGNLPDGRLAAAQTSSARRGLKIEWSFLLDSLQAERDQGVTIDATRLPFALSGRPFVVVDAPGHRMFLRNMITGSADAAAAVLVVDAAEGARDQTRRHAWLLRSLGIRHVIVALNKADKLDFDKARIAAASGAIGTLLDQVGINAAAVIPLSARHGDNIATRSTQSSWYGGPTLVEALSAVPHPVSQSARPFRMSVQDVYRINDQRAVVGRIDGGQIEIGGEISINGGALARVADIKVWSAAPPVRAVAGQSVALLLEPEIVLARGDLLHAPAHPPQAAARLRARVFWLRSAALRSGEAFSLRLASAEYAVTVVAINSVVDIADMSDRAADHVPPEGFAEIELAAARRILFDPFEPGSPSGRGVLVDAHQQVVGGAALTGAAALAPNAVFPTSSAVAPGERAGRKGHDGAVFWLTGLPGSGKSTLARLAERTLFDVGVDVVVLDGDTLRAGLNSDLGFSESDRNENNRRAAAVARLLAEAGQVVIVSLISPRAADRALAREIVGPGFHEVHVSADSQACEARDPKGLWAASRAGRLQGFTGVDAPYDVPAAPDLVVTTQNTPLTDSVEGLVTYIRGAVAAPGPRGTAG